MPRQRSAIRRRHAAPRVICAAITPLAQRHAGEDAAHCCRRAAARRRCHDATPPRRDERRYADFSRALFRRARRYRKMRRAAYAACVAMLAFTERCRQEHAAATRGYTPPADDAAPPPYEVFARALRHGGGGAMKRYTRPANRRAATMR